jgi:Protein of unknown function (DUF1488)
MLPQLRWWPLILKSFRRLRSATYTMTLGFPNQSRFYDATRLAVRFWGHDSAMEASFLPRGIVSILRAVSGGCNELPTTQGDQYQRYN